MDLSIGKGMRWWEKGAEPNMKEITSAQDLVDSLMQAGDKLVIVDFFSPGCAGCKSLHPKICQFAEQNPHILFLPVNYEKHKSMCYSLNVHVLPFFRFYRGAHGRLCSFSCTNATSSSMKFSGSHKQEDHPPDSKANRWFFDLGEIGKIKRSKWLNRHMMSMDNLTEHGSCACATFKECP